MISPRSTALDFKHEGQDFKLVFDMETIARFEDSTDLSIFEAVSGLGIGRAPKLSVLGALLQAALFPHHPEVTRADAMAMMVNPEVQQLFLGGIKAAMPQPGDTGEAGEATQGNRRTRRAGKASAGKTG